MKAVKELYAAFAFWMAYFLVLPVCGVLVFAVTSALSLIWWIFIYPLRCTFRMIKMNWIHSSNRDHTEKLFIDEMFPVGTAHYTIPVCVPYPHAYKPFVMVDMNVVVSGSQNNESGREKPYLIVFHGVGSSATLMLSTTIKTLTQRFNVISVDVPGLGRSVINEICLDNMSADECLSFFRAFYRVLFHGYVDAIIKTHRQLSVHSKGDQAFASDKISSVYVLGHSLGGYLTVMSLFDWTNSPTAKSSSTDPPPEHSTGILTPISGLILVCPAGVLPSLSPHGAYWAILFYTGFPMSVLRNMGSMISSLLAIPLMYMGNFYANARTPYWFQLQGSSHMVNIAKKFMNVGYKSMYWTHPCLQCILRSHLPVGLVWGEEDEIMPVGTGRLVVDLCRKLDKDVQMSVVSGAGHTPFHFQGGRNFAEKVRDAVVKIQLGSQGNATATPLSPTQGAASGQQIRQDMLMKNFSRILIRNHICGLLDETYAYDVLETEYGSGHGHCENSTAANFEKTTSGIAEDDHSDHSDLLQVHRDTLFDSYEHHMHSHRYIHTTRWVSSFSLHATQENLEDMYDHLHASVDKIAAILQDGISTG